MNCSLQKKVGKRGRYITAMLFISLIFNIIALFAPFTSLSNIFSSTVSVSLPYSVYVMWIKGLYAIAILIAGFSIIFPFIKLYYLYKTWFFIKDKDRRHKIIYIIEPLGKWSMLDVFATCIILILCSDQIVVYGTPMIGVVFFLIAIFLSITASLLIEYLHIEYEQDANYFNFNTSKSHTIKAKLCHILALILFILTLVIFSVGIFIPYQQITSFILIGYSYSIFTSITSLASTSIILSIFLLITLIIFPFLHLVGNIIFWYKKVFNRDISDKLVKFIKICSRFNMLDVFLLGFLIFIFEGKSMLKVEHRFGVVVMAIVIFMALVLPQLVKIIKKTYEK